MHWNKALQVAQIFVIEVMTVWLHCTTKIVANFLIFFYVKLRVFGIGNTAKCFPGNFFTLRFSDCFKLKIMKVGDNRYFIVLSFNC